MFITSRNFSQLRELISSIDAERNNPEVILIGCRKHPEMIRRQSECHCRRSVAAKAGWLLGERAVDFHILRQRFRIVDAIVIG